MPIETGSTIEHEINPDLLKSVVNAIVGKNRLTNPEKQQVADNILSIRKATKNGKHDTLFYPSCGFDILRPLVAYDISHLIAADNCIGIETMAEEITRFNPQREIIDSADGNVRQITFELEGKKRQITLVNNDARLVNLHDFEIDQVDILHTYLPMDADQPLTEFDLFLKEKFDKGIYFDDIEIAENDSDCPKPIDYRESIALFEDDITTMIPVYQTIHPGFHGFNNSQIVSLGGFLIYNESSDWMQNNEKYGFRQIEISRRSEPTVSTSFHDSEPRKTGYIYQRVAPPQNY
ncbi:MAG: hypothetical protein KIH89_001665 [Candidatus Shapirobacteria bacterium]|nr:hypothetical protein [Candidatus Shapirobacteria bacterium]